MDGLPEWNRSRMIEAESLSGRDRESVLLLLVVFHLGIYLPQIRFSRLACQNIVNRDHGCEHRVVLIVIDCYSDAYRFCPTRTDFAKLSVYSRISSKRP